MSVDVSKTSAGRLVGYARVSTLEQDLQLQIDALRDAGIDRSLMFTDKASGANSERPGLERCLAELHYGDTLVVWRLDRLGRSMIHLVETISELRERGVGFQSLSDGVIDTTSPSGELVFMIFSALAQFERRLIQERTNAGLAAARARGRFGGRPKLTASHPKVRAAIEMHRTSLSVSEICRSLGISRASLYRYLKLAPNNRPGVSDSRP